MAFAGKLGNLLRQNVGNRVRTGVVSSNPFLGQAVRCMSVKLFVGGIHYGTDEAGLRDAFSSYGEVVEAKIIVDRETGRSRGFGFISFASDDNASAAISGMDGKDLHGRTINVNYATGGGGFRGSGSFGGGSYGGSGGYGRTAGYEGGGGGYGGGGRGYEGGASAQGGYGGGGQGGYGDYGSGQGGNVGYGSTGGGYGAGVDGGRATADAAYGGRSNSYGSTGGFGLSSDSADKFPARGGGYGAADGWDEDEPDRFADKRA